MSRPKTVLDVPEVELEVAGKTFLLREMSGEEITRYFEVELRAVLAAMKARSGEDLSDVQAALEEAKTLNDELTAFMLPGSTPEWRNGTLTYSLRKKIQEVFEQLNCLEEIRGNRLGLLPGDK